MRFHECDRVSWGINISEELLGISPVTFPRWLPLLIPGQWIQIPVLLGINFRIWILFMLLLHHGFSFSVFTGHASVHLYQCFSKSCKKWLLLMNLLVLYLQEWSFLFAQFYFSINSLIFHASGSVLFHFIIV